MKRIEMRGEHPEEEIRITQKSEREAVTVVSSECIIIYPRSVVIVRHSS